MGKRFGIDQFEAKFGEFRERLVNQLGLLQGDPRATALLGAAFLDYQLGLLLAKSIVVGANSDRLLTDHGAPLGHFSARIEAAFDFGLIADHERDDLHLIRKVRNEFAHHPDAHLSFESAGISQLCSNIDCWKAFPEPGKTAPRDQFVGAVLLGGMFLESRIQQARPREAAARHYEPGWRPGQRVGPPLPTEK